MGHGEMLSTLKMDMKSRLQILERTYIYLYLPSGRIWHKVILMSGAKHRLISMHDRCKKCLFPLALKIHAMPIAKDIWLPNSFFSVVPLALSYLGDAPVDQVINFRSSTRPTPTPGAGMQYQVSIVSHKYVMGISAEESVWGLTSHLS